MKIDGGKVDLPLNNDYPARAIFDSTLPGSEIRLTKKSAQEQQKSFWGFPTDQKLIETAVLVGTTTAVS